MGLLVGFEAMQKGEISRFDPCQLHQNKEVPQSVLCQLNAVTTLGQGLKKRGNYERK